MVAARFKQMNIPALLIERNKRIGDNWRQRYLSLALHTVREHHQRTLIHMFESISLHQYNSSIIPATPIHMASLHPA